MDFIDKIVYFEQYCPTCKSAECAQDEEPCNECLGQAVSSMKKQEYLQVLVELNKLKLPGNNAMNVRYNQGVEAAKKLLREFVEEKRR